MSSDKNSSPKASDIDYYGGYIDYEYIPPGTRTYTPRFESLFTPEEYPEVYSWLDEQDKKFRKKKEELVARGFRDDINSKGKVVEQSSQQESQGLIVKAHFGDFTSEIIDALVEDTKEVEGKKYTVKRLVRVKRITSTNWDFQRIERIPVTPENIKIIMTVAKSYVRVSDKKFFKRLRKQGHFDGVPSEYLLYRTAEERDDAERGIPREGWTARLSSRSVWDRIIS